MSSNPQTIHYNKLRNFLGIMGFILPIILLCGSYMNPKCGHIQNSISAYYYTPFISVFCGLLFSISIFLFTYPGFNKTDKWVTNIAGVFAICVAIFPVKYPLDGRDICNTAIESSSTLISDIHMSVAAAFFFTIATISFFIFTQTYQSTQEGITTDEKLFRNNIYHLCGIVIYISIILLALNEFEIIDLKPIFIKPVFIFETICLFAFGISWLIKGGTLFADGSKTYNKLPEILKTKRRN